MKPPLFILFITLSNFLFAQSEITPKSKLGPGINLSSSISGEGSDINFNPTINLGINRHVLAIVPCFTWSEEFYVDGKSGTKLSGLQGYYQFYPNPEQKVIDFYFQNDFIYQSYKGTGSNWESTYSSVEHYLGYEFNIKFLQHFYFNNNVGIGMYFSRAKTIYTDTQHGEDYRYNKLSGIFKVGLGYQFK